MVMKYGCVSLICDGYSDGDSVYELIEKELKKHNIEVDGVDGDRSGEFINMTTSSKNPPKQITISIPLGEFEEEEEW
jgi:hypothetical protein